jgi:hypothetical protein
MLHHVNVAGALSALALLASCTGPVWIPPASVGTLEVTDTWTNQDHPFPCPVRTGGLFGFSPSSGDLEVGAGFDLFYDPGTPPFACEEGHQVLAKANVVFDVDELGVATFDQAWLTFRLSSTGRPIGGDDFPGVPACLLRLGIATESWPSGLTSLPDGSTGSRPTFTLLGTTSYLLRDPLTAGRVPRADVTSTVRAWMSGRSVNHGFVLIPFTDPTTEAPRPSRVRRLNGSCTAFANDFRLEVTRGP